MVWDATIGLYDYAAPDGAVARFYDPQVGQFTQPDSLIPEPENPIAWNRYAYVYNSPINFTDPSGLVSCDSWPESIKPLCVGANAGDLNTIALLYNTVVVAGHAMGGDYKLSALMMGHYLHGNGKTLDLSRYWARTLGKDPQISAETSRLFTRFIRKDVATLYENELPTTVSASYKGLDGFYEWDNRPRPQSRGLYIGTGHFAVNGDFWARISCRKSKEYLLKFTAEYFVDESERYEWFPGKETSFTLGTGETIAAIPHNWAIALRDATPARAHEYQWTATWKDKGRILISNDFSDFKYLEWWEYQ